jgi:hypothetical protein
LFAPYSQHDLEQVVKDFLGDNLLSSAGIRLVLPAYNATEGNVHVFKHLLDLDRQCVEARGYTWVPSYSRFDPLSAAAVGAATAAPPTYFPAKRISALHADFIDGGVWANSPIWPAVAEATGPLGRAFDELSILSVGTRFQTLKVGWWKRKGGFIPWNVHVIELLMNAQAAGAIGAAQWVFRSAAFLRIDDRRDPAQDPSDPPLSLDRVSSIAGLVKRANAKVEEKKTEICAFLNQWRVAGTTKRPN